MLTMTFENIHTTTKYNALRLKSHVTISKCRNIYLLYFLFVSFWAGSQLQLTKKLARKNLITEERTKIHSNGEQLCHTYSISSLAIIWVILALFMSAVTSVEIAFSIGTRANCFLVYNGMTSKIPLIGQCLWIYVSSSCLTESLICSRFICKQSMFFHIAASQQPRHIS